MLLAVWAVLASVAAAAGCQTSYVHPNPLALMQNVPARASCLAPAHVMLAWPWGEHFSSKASPLQTALKRELGYCRGNCLLTIHSLQIGRWKGVEYGKKIRLIDWPVASSQPESGIVGFFFFFRLFLLRFLSTKRLHLV